MWEEGPVPDALRAYPGYLMARLGDASRRRFRRALEPERLHPRYFGVMVVVAAEPGITQNQLRDRTGIDPSSMVTVIDDLEAMGVAERRPHPTDRRARAIYLTTEGEGKLARVTKLTAELQRELFEPLTPEEQRTLTALLQKLVA